MDISLSNDILEAMGTESYENAIIEKNTKKLVIHLKSENEVLKVNPNFEKMKYLKFKV